MVIVLLLLTATMALSYAVMRSQGTAILIQNNSARRASARAAARTGLNMAIARMHRTSQWNGVGSTFTRQLGDTEGFTATFIAGDDALDSSSPDWDDLPYRVTIEVEGYASDPAFPASIATARMSAVVRLSPHAMPDEPPDWEIFQQYTVFQGRSSNLEIELPVQIEGPVRIQGALSLATNSISDADAREQYLEDLGRMKDDGQGDYRPFTGPVTIDYSENLQAVVYLASLGVATNDASDVTISNTWNVPTSMSTYQVYPGGPVYDVAMVSGTLSNTILVPDPETNPLGIYFASEGVTIGNNVTVLGALVSTKTVSIAGEGVVFESQDLMPLMGTSEPIRLPVVAAKNLSVFSPTSTTLTGFVAILDDFWIGPGSEDESFQMTGRMVAKKRPRIMERDEWAATLWQTLHTMWDPDGPVPYFPHFAAIVGRNPTPMITIRPDPSPVRYHWFDVATPTLFKPDTDSGEEGLYWDLVRIESAP